MGSGKTWREKIWSQGCRGPAGSSHSCSKVLVILPVFPLSQKQVGGCLSLCPTWALGFPGPVLGPPPHQFLSWIFWNFMPLSYPILSPGQTHPFMLMNLALPVLTSNSASSSDFYRACAYLFPCATFASTAGKPSKRILPWLFIPPTW